MKTITICCLCILLSSALFAQTYQRKTPEEKAKKYTAEMVDFLQLPNEVAEKIYLINVGVSKQFDSLYASKPEKDLLRAQTIEIIRQRDIEFRKILSNEQFLRYDDYQREKREKKRKEQAEKNHEEIKK